jgi:hypothetical protein
LKSWGPQGDVRLWISGDEMIHQVIQIHFLNQSWWFNLT